MSVSSAGSSSVDDALSSSSSSSSSVDEVSFGLSTRLVHSGVSPDSSTGAILTPIYQSTTFVQPSVEDYLHLGYSYSRSGNPTVRSLEMKLRDLDSGYDACCFSTGMAATCTVFSAFLCPGDHCVITNCSYGGTNRCARVHFSRYNIKFDFIDFRDVQNIADALRPETKMVFSESPCNPTLFLADIEAISNLTRDKGIIHVCDSTFATPVIMQPIKLGADIVIHSTTKFYDGHNITTGGVVVSANKDLHDKIKFHQNILGNIMSPQVAFYTLQTTKTLLLRVQKQCHTAFNIATMLETHQKVLQVGYPGLKSFKQRELAIKQHYKQLHGTMLWCEVKGGTEAGVRLMNVIKPPWSLCENLGTCESIITCPAVFTHANMLREDRLKVGITDGFIRLSVGIEDEEDLIASLMEALNQI